MSEADPYFDPAHHVLRNRLGITHADRLDSADRRLVTQRLTEGLPAGDLDFAHLRAIHRHLFQDLFDWAGEPRVIDLIVGDDHFQTAAKIAGDLEAIYRDLAARRRLAGLDPGDFAREAAILFGDVHFVHPFRAGNMRAQLAFLKLLAEQAGHPLDLARLPAEPWLEATRACLGGDPEPMAALILFALS